jgi:hypothetical protein
MAEFELLRRKVQQLKEGLDEEPVQLGNNHMLALKLGSEGYRKKIEKLSLHLHRQLEDINEEIKSRGIRDESQ